MSWDDRSLKMPQMHAHDDVMGRVMRDAVRTRNFHDSSFSFRRRDTFIWLYSIHY
jgi:hypothetical protein